MTESPPPDPGSAVGRFFGFALMLVGAAMMVFGLLGGLCAGLVVAVSVGSGASSGAGPLIVAVVALLAFGVACIYGGWRIYRSAGGK